METLCHLALNVLYDNIKVAISVPFSGLFDYKISPSKKNEHTGKRIIVPFGKKLLLGVIVAYAPPAIAASKIRSIHSILDDKVSYTSSMQNLRLWLCDYYVASYGDAFIATLPRFFRSQHQNSLEPQLLNQTTLYKYCPKSDTDKKYGKNQLQILELFAQKPALTQDEINQSNINKNSLTRLISTGVIEKTTTTLQPKIPKITTNKPIETNQEQQKIIDEINKNINKFIVHLLHGVTGSGKTRVYIALIVALFNRPENATKQVILLAPEIGLVNWLAQEISAMINIPVHIYHSDISPKKQAKIWLAMQNQPMVIVGTRSAIFLPQDNVKLIIIDEEQDNSYKNSTSSMRYNARDVAIKTAKMQNIPVLLGSATPALQTWHNANTKKYQLHSLHKRATPVDLPVISVADMQPLKSSTIFHPSTKKLIDAELQKNNRVLIFLNRRGSSPMTYCLECDWNLTCVNCSKKMVWHQDKNYLSCHYCGAKSALPKSCPECNSTKITQAGFGTQSIESYVKSIYKNQNVVRLDQDKATKNPAKDIAEQLPEKEAGIIIATQLFTKGYSIHNLQLVVALQVDSALFSMDIFALEHCSQLLLQVAGRSGRQNKKGAVVLQTNLPEEKLWQLIIKHQYNLIAEFLLQDRQSLELPPFSRMCVVHAVGLNESKTATALNKISVNILKHHPKLKSICPTASAFTKRNNYFYWQFIIWGNLQEILKVKKYLHNLPQIPQVKIVIDVDPVSIND